MDKTNHRDVFFKVFWTVVVVSLGTAIAAIGDLPYVWVPILASLFNVALAYARQQTGETPPTLS